MILNLLEDGEKCACELLESLAISQPTLSHHMKILCDADVVCPRKDGKWTHYSLSAKGLDNAKTILAEITEAASHVNK
ncbi:MAG: ArsR/SmtB family transcription factor [Lachnospiraceae bacterium]